MTTYNLSVTFEYGFPTDYSRFCSLKFIASPSNFFSKILNKKEYIGYFDIMNVFSKSVIHLISELEPNIKNTVTKDFIIEAIIEQRPFGIHLINSNIIINIPYKILEYILNLNNEDNNNLCKYYVDDKKEKFLFHFEDGFEEIKIKSISIKN
jgi:hypothetical protein